MEDRTEQILAFLTVIEKAKFIERKLYLSNGRNENVAEHSWHMAIFMLLFEKEFPNADTAKVLKLILTHDLVEIYAGDTFAFDKEGHKDKKERETKAASKLYGMLPRDLRKEFMGLFEEYERGESKEALIAISFDKLQATLQNIHSGCGVWKENNVTMQDVDDYIRKHMVHDKFLFELYEKLFKKAENVMNNDRMGLQEHT